MAPREKWNLVSDPRAAGQVRRYSTWHVHRDQSVGEHTWQVMRILMTIWPKAPRNVIIHALVHDMGEMAGDIQYPFKNMFPELRAGADKAENYVQHMQRRDMGIPEVTHPLSPFEKQVFKLCDNLEMWEFGLVERNMGNRYADIVAARMQEAVARNLENIEEMATTKQYQDNAEIIGAVHRYMQNRMEAEHGQE
jgi:5'-deoxynucleotidase YfbR-like HD superfamily hydrolase